MNHSEFGVVHKIEGHQLEEESHAFYDQEGLQSHLSVDPVHHHVLSVDSDLEEDGHGDGDVVALMDHHHDRSFGDKPAFPDTLAVETQPMDSDSELYVSADSGHRLQSLPSGLAESEKEEISKLLDPNPAVNRQHRPGDSVRNQQNGHRQRMAVRRVKAKVKGQRGPPPPRPMKRGDVEPHTVPLKPASYCRPSVWNQVGTVEDVANAVHSKSIGNASGPQRVGKKSSSGSSGDDEWYLDEERFSFERKCSWKESLNRSVMNEQLMMDDIVDDMDGPEEAVDSKKVPREHAFSQIVGDHALGQEMVMEDIVEEMVLSETEHNQFNDNAMSYQPGTLTQTLR